MSNEPTEMSASPEAGTKAAEELSDRYLALWNEPDADRRRQTIAELWTQDARHFVQPPQEIRAIATQPGIGLTAILEARGHEAIETRVASAYEHRVGSEGLSFQRRDDAEQLGDVLKFHWDALDRDGELFVVGQQRECYLAGSVSVIEHARRAYGCLDFSVTADLLDPGRVNLFERWESLAAVKAFRRSTPRSKRGAAMLSASVAEYDVADARPLVRKGKA